MRSIRTFFAVVAAVTLGLMAPALPSSAAEPGQDWMTVDRVLVNRLGGVNVSGLVSCQGVYDDLMAGALGQWSWDDEAQEDVWVPIPAPDPDTAVDQVNILVNPDNYTVRQPAGRRLMIQAVHESSILSPCHLDYPYTTEGSSWPAVYREQVGDAYRWQTSRFGYDRELYGPLFDYSPNGKFKTGLLNVEAYLYGAVVFVHHGSDPATGWDTYGVDDAPDIYFNGNVKAVTYR